jgi:DNA-binding transcriptional LysR family regulator
MRRSIAQCDRQDQHLRLQPRKRLAYPATMEDWNDLRLVLALSRTGSLKGAAQTLGVNHSTAFRRLGALEQTLGVRLFERLPGGVYAATAAGERTAAVAERVETDTATLDRDIVGLDRRLTGHLRVTSSETLAFRLLTAHVARFRDQHPGIIVELTVERRVLSLSRREADIALRVTRPREGDLYGRKLAEIAWAVYGTKMLISQNAPSGSEEIELSGFPFVAWDETATGIQSADWLASRIPPGGIVFRTNSVLNHFIAARAGIGLAVLPCYLGDPDPELQRVLPLPIPELTGELWIVTHTDLRRTARVRAFFESVGEALVSQREMLAGR